VIFNAIRSRKTIACLWCSKTAIINETRVVCASRAHRSARNSTLGKGQDRREGRISLCTPSLPGSLRIYHDDIRDLYYVEYRRDNSSESLFQSFSRRLIIAISGWRFRVTNYGAGRPHWVASSSLSKGETKMLSLSLSFAQKGKLVRRNDAFRTPRLSLFCKRICPQIMLSPLEPCSIFARNNQEAFNNVWDVAKFSLKI